MSHSKLWPLLDKMQEECLCVQREHHSNGKTQIRILSPFWEVLHDGWYTTGDTDRQCYVMERVLNQYIGGEYD